MKRRFFVICGSWLVFFVVFGALSVFPLISSEALALLGGGVGAMLAAPVLHVQFRLLEIED